MPEPGKGFRAVALAIYAIAGAALVYEGLRTHFSNGFFGVLLPIASIGMVRLLVVLKVIELPPWFSMGFVNRAPKYAEFGKAAACMFAALLWTVIVVRVVSDTPLGAAILFLPPVLLLIAMGIFVLRGLFH
jgi:hypothetical protein